MRMSPRSRSVAVMASAWIASCSPFGSGADDGATAADAAGSDAAAVPDGPDGPNDGGVVPDAGPISRDAGTCRAPGAILCFDFDGPDPSAGLKIDSNNGSVSFGSTFTGGSLPNAAVAAVTAKMGRATLTAPTIDLTAHKSAVVVVDFRFLASRAATAVEYVARLNFAGQSSPIAFDSANGLQCGVTTFSTVNPGPHALSVRITVDASGNATGFTCALDLLAAGPLATVAASSGLSIELGNVNSGSGNFTVSYDDLLVHSP